GRDRERKSRRERKRKREREREKEREHRHLWFLEAGCESGHACMACGCLCAQVSVSDDHHHHHHHWAPTPPPPLFSQQRCLLDSRRVCRARPDALDSCNLRVYTL